MSRKSVFFINNHTAFLGYKILIISIRYQTIRFDLIDKLKMLIYRLSMTSLLDRATLPGMLFHTLTADGKECLKHLHYRETCASASSGYVQITALGLLVEASLFRVISWLHIHLFFYLSKVLFMVYFNICL